MPRILPFPKPEPWQIRYLFELGTNSWLIHCGAAVLTGLLMYQWLPHETWPLWWTLAMAVFSLLQYALSRYGEAEQRTDRELLFAGYANTALTLVVGTIWGLGAFGFASADFTAIASYGLAVAGTALGAISINHSVLRTSFASLSTSVPMVGLAHMMNSGALPGIPIAGMCLLYGILLMLLAMRLNRFLTEVHDLNQSLDTKVAELTAMTGDLEQARQEAEDANLSKSRFLAQASHDLRQPMHAIGLLTASLVDTRLSNEQRRMVESIGKSVDSVTNLFGSLLDMSRLDVGVVDPNVRPLDMGALLRRVEEQNKELAMRSSCDLRIVGTTQWVLSDDALVFSMVQNILSNAFKYAPGSAVLAGMRRQGDRLSLQIVDAGPGIAKEQMDAVFNEFYRLDTNTFGSVEGMGLGLAIVRRLGDLLGLTVTLRSTPGLGNAVTISGFERTDPVVQTQAKPAQRHPLAGKRICLVDDDPVVLTATSELLARWGCVVHPTTGAPDEQTEFDAILADLYPDGDEDGLALIRRLRERSGRKVPAVILTGRMESELPELAAAEGIPVLEKPVRPVVLRATLTQLWLEPDDAAETPA